MSWGLADVRVRRGRVLALDGVTVPVGRSGVTVVVGGDGAGKSTCLQALVGLVEPESGTVRRPPKERVGYVPATCGIYPDLTVAENIEFAALAYGVGRGERDRRAARILGRTGLDQALRRLGGQLSGGMQRKLAVGLALLHSPELLVLDEPTTGVDPVSRAELWRLISGAAAGGTAVAVATAYVNEAARGERVVLLESGRMLASGSPEEILRAVPGAVGVVPGAAGTAAGAGTAAARPARWWRRGPAWRVWAPDGELPEGAEPAEPDFDDAVMIAALAHEAGGAR